MNGSDALMIIAVAPCPDDVGVCIVILAGKLGGGFVGVHPVSCSSMTSGLWLYSKSCSSSCRLVAVSMFQVMM